MAQLVGNYTILISLQATAMIVYDIVHGRRLKERSGTWHIAYVMAGYVHVRFDTIRKEEFNVNSTAG